MVKVGATVHITGLLGRRSSRQGNGGCNSDKVIEAVEDGFASLHEAMSKVMGPLCEGWSTSGASLQ